MAELGRGAALVIHAVALVLAEGGLTVPGLKHWVTVCSVTQSSDIKATVQTLSHTANCHPNNILCCSDVANVAGTCQAQRETLRVFIKTTQNMPQ